MNRTTNPSLISSDITKFCYLLFSTVVNRVTLFIGHFLNHINLFLFHNVGARTQSGHTDELKRKAAGTCI